jgi:hypothetical protein
MTATVTVPVQLRERLAALLDAWSFGLLPPADCTACKRRGDGGWCEACARAQDDAETAGAAVVEVEAAGSSAEALAAYVTCCLELTGISQEEWSVGINGAYEPVLAAIAGTGGAR